MLILIQPMFTVLHMHDQHYVIGVTFKTFALIVRLSIVPFM